MDRWQAENILKLYILDKIVNNNSCLNMNIKFEDGNYYYYYHY